MVLRHDIHGNQGPEAGAKIRFCNLIYSILNDPYDQFAIGILDVVGLCLLFEPRGS